MNKFGEIVVVEHNLDYQQFIYKVVADLQISNPVTVHADGLSALEYLREHSGGLFLIICDTDLPDLSGPDLRNKIRKENSALKIVPFVFLSEPGSKIDLAKEYGSSVQGIFAKPVEYKRFREMMMSLLDYWKKCRQPRF